MTAGTLENLALDHVRCYVEDLDASVTAFTGGYGLALLDTTEDERERTAVVGGPAIRLLLTEPLTDDHPGSAYIAAHGFGVADIAFAVDDVTDAYTEAVGRGATPVAEPRDGTAILGGFGDVVHTLISRPLGIDVQPGSAAAAAAAAGEDLITIDHFAVCVPTGTLDEVAAYYQRVFGFELTFTEQIVVGPQGMDSKVVQNPRRDVTFTLIEPDPAREPGQIDRFLKDHDGAGVQHVAFLAADIVASVRALGSRGVEFLSTPSPYYAALERRLRLERHSVEELAELHILADADHSGQLLQIFTRSAHPRGTIFFELIERIGARTFGSGNIHALYAAVEAERDR